MHVSSFTFNINKGVKNYLYQFKKNAATKPEIAAGIVMRMVVVTRLAPSPAEASRSELGTAAKASSETDAINGTVSIPTPIPAAARVNPAESG